MEIGGTGFGWIEAGSVRFNHDIVVFPDGRVANRYSLVEGSNHLFGPDEARVVLDGTTADIVLGTGQFGAVRVMPGTAALLDGLEVRLHVARTPEAVRIYNRLAGPRCAVFHVTC